LESLKKLENLNIQEVFDAHKGLIPNGVEALKAKIQFMEDTSTKVQELRDKGTPLGEIVLKVLGKEDIFSKITGGHMSKLNGVKSILHLNEDTQETPE
jgi:hypothetical protein